MDHSNNLVRSLPTAAHLPRSFNLASNPSTFSTAEDDELPRYPPRHTTTPGGNFVKQLRWLVTSLRNCAKLSWRRAAGVEAFTFHDTKACEEEISRFFSTNKWESVKRQLNNYGFMRLQDTSPRCSTWFHLHFTQGGESDLLVVKPPSAKKQKLTNQLNTYSHLYIQTPEVNPAATTSPQCSDQANANDDASRLSKDHPKNHPKDPKETAEQSRPSSFEALDALAAAAEATSTRTSSRTSLGASSGGRVLGFSGGGGGGGARTVRRDASAAEGSSGRRVTSSPPALESSEDDNQKDAREDSTPQMVVQREDRGYEKQQKVTSRGTDGEGVMPKALEVGFNGVPVSGRPSFLLEPRAASSKANSNPGLSSSANHHHQQQPPPPPPLPPHLCQHPLYRRPQQLQQAPPAPARQEWQPQTRAGLPGGSFGGGGGSGGFEDYKGEGACSYGGMHGEAASNTAPDAAWASPISRTTVPLPPSTAGPAVSRISQGKLSSPVLAGTAARTSISSPAAARVGDDDDNDKVSRPIE
eukprot:CAMPEP_0171807582 /NCGR_PEP_ID=MMETSP0991-20121206/75910_1 /TAXON_ID=483369 /ORGANISM="non described non described, Strain CCMP2098" /LENGTH=526 /DNA_ID=CAMNT_0012420409 /DNA_START=24 /DNA_END=1603 /DNA_ORIENTATION=-